MAILRDASTEDFTLSLKKLSVLLKGSTSKWKSDVLIKNISVRDTLWTQVLKILSFLRDASTEDFTVLLENFTLKNPACCIQYLSLIHI